jgi:hypothetical protein
LEIDAMTAPTPTDITQSTPTATQGDDTPESVATPETLEMEMAAIFAPYFRNGERRGLVRVLDVSPHYGNEAERDKIREEVCRRWNGWGAQAAEIARLSVDHADTHIKLKAANAKIERMRKVSEGSDQWANDVIAAICKHVGLDGADEEFTADAIAEMLDQHSAEFESRESRATKAEAYERGCADTQRWPTEGERVEQMAGDIHHDAGLIGAELERVQTANGAFVLPGDPNGIHALLTNIKRQADAIRARCAEKKS